MSIRFKEPAYIPAEQEYLEAQRKAALAAAMPSQSAYAAMAHPMDFRTGLSEYAARQQSQMASEAQSYPSELDREQKMARFRALEAKRNARMSNPKFRMAAMLAMAGQPGALQAMVMPQPDNSGASVAQAQDRMDNLETQLMSDVYALGTEKNKYAREKLLQSIRNIYSSKFRELESQGAKSRMGGWDGWESQLSQIQGKVKSDAETARKEREKSNKQLIKLFSRPETEN